MPGYIILLKLLFNNISGSTKYFRNIRLMRLLDQCKTPIGVYWINLNLRISNVGVLKTDMHCLPVCVLPL